MSEVLLEAKGISKSFPGVRALDSVSFTIKKGEVHALMGENGAGKSTLIKIISGLYQKDEGEIHFNNGVISPNSPKEAEELGIATIYQELNLSSFQSVSENLFLGREPVNRFGIIDRKKMQKESEKILGELGIHIEVEKPLNNYSTAIQQMVAIARAVNTNAQLVIMDEPTSSLDQDEVQVLFGIIRLLKERGVSVVFISHFLDEVYEISDSITVLKDGQFVATKEATNLSQLELIKLMVGVDPSKYEVGKTIRDFSQQETMLATSNLRDSIKLNGIDIEIKKGEVVGLAGLLGSGRTEVADVLFGVNTDLSSGKVFWYDNPVTFKNPKEAMKLGMGYGTEDRKQEGIFPNLSVKENLTMAMLPKITKNGFVDNKKQAEIVDYYIDKMKIKTPSPNQLIKNLSGGNQQKILLARWMATDPELMILDEPTRGIDVGAKHEIELMIQNFAAMGISVLMISSEYKELERNCDRVYVLRDGATIGELKGHDITQDRILETIAHGAELEEAANETH